MNQPEQINQRVTNVLTAVAALGLSVFDPFGWDQFGPIRWLVIGGLGFWALALSTNPAPVDSSILTKLWAALLAWGAITSVLGADKLHAWIGTPDRRFGWLTWLLCAALFQIARQQGKREQPQQEQRRRRVLQGFAVGALGLGCYALLEWIGTTFGSGPLWPTASIDFAGGRTGGPYGQPAFLGAAAVLASPIAAAVAVDTAQTARWRILGAAGAVTTLFAVLASQSRAAWAGLAIAGLLYATSANRTSKKRTAVERTAVERTASLRYIGAAIAAFVLAVFVVPDLRQRITGAFATDGVIAGRTDEWRVGLRALGQAPVFGYGPEGYRTAFGENVDDDYILKWGWEVITDRAHNAILDVALAFGIPGALLYLTIIGLIGRGAIRAIRSGETSQSFLGLGVIAYLVQQQFLFPLSEIDPLMWLAAGLLPTLAKTTPDRVPSSAKTKAIHSVTSGLAIGLAVIVSAAALLDVAANVRLGRAIEPQTAELQEDQTRNLEDGARAASRLRPDSIRYHFISARAARQAGDLPVALSRIETGLKRSSNDPALLGEQGRLLLEIARATPAGPDADEAIDAARQALESLVDRAPYNPEHLQRLAIARALDGDVEAGITLMEEAARLAPDRPEPQQNLAELRRLAGDR